VIRSLHPTQVMEGCPVNHIDFVCFFAVEITKPTVSPTALKVMPSRRSVRPNPGGRTPGRAFPLCPSSSDINLFRTCQRVINLDAEITNRTFDLGVSEQELDGPEVACSSIDQGSFCAAQ
jgi:hypothetical protein